MPKIKYIDKRFAPATLEVIEEADDIITEYQLEGFKLTLRQLYYQFVARGLIANKQSEYKRLGSIINDARLAGLIDWEAIEDRGRNRQSLSSWPNPQAIIRSAAASFHLDHWHDQEHRLEVWIEKEALIGIIEDICERYDVPYFACKGYVSQSEMWQAAQRMIEHVRNDQLPVIIHLGDHDPSGIDMTRDIEDRLELFVGARIPVQRIALNMNQVRKYNPPPNPAKATDKRFETYYAQHGRESWELDALDPKVISRLIQKEISRHLDVKKFNATAQREQDHIEELKEVSDQWDDIVEDFCVGNRTPEDWDGEESEDS